jgi:putative ABC transport system permease protein
MGTFQLLRRNLSYYWRTHLAVVLGVATAVAVLTGALMVGQSVRASLRELLLNRLGKTDDVISAAGYFREQLASDLESLSQFATRFQAVCPLIVLEGTVTHQENKRRAAGVVVYAVDDRFFRFHQQDQAAPKEREAFLSPTLARELGVRDEESLLLKVEKPSAIPAEFLQGHRDTQEHTLRLSASGAQNSLGEFTIRPQQGDVRALFVSLRRVQRELELAGKVNTILVAERDSTQAWQQGRSQLERALRQVLQLQDLGIKLRVLAEQPCLVLETESTLISESLEQAARATANELGLKTSSILTYLANFIRSGEAEVPYSLVTAMDRESLARLETEQERVPARNNKSTSAAQKGNNASSSEPPILLNDWTARALRVQPGAEISLDYYAWLPEGRLVTRSAQFCLSRILPLKGIVADRELVPEYPGITTSDNLSDWDPPFPMDLRRIRPRDEAYWHQYRTAPKGYIPLEVGQALWQSRFGRLSSLRFFSKAGSDLTSVQESYRRKLTEVLGPLQPGLSVYAVRGQGLEASQGATDFGEYFLYFSFFLVVSALLLTALFFKLGVEQRLREIGLLQALGFSRRRIRALFFSEGLVLAIVGSIAGVAGAVVFGEFIMWGLGHWWSGAVGTARLSFHWSPSSVGVGVLGGVLTAVLCIAATLRSLGLRSPRSLLSGGWGEEGLGAEESGKRQSRESLQDQAPRVSRSPFPRFPVSPFLPFATAAVLVLTLAATLLLLAASFRKISQVAGFFGAGTLLLSASLLQQTIRLKRGDNRLLQEQGWRGISRLGFRNARQRPGRSALCVTLIASASFIVVAVDAFRREGSLNPADRKSGTGGYSLLANSSLPLFHDLNTREGRETLSLDAHGNTVLEKVGFSRFRVRPGDDTSCLNLYQARNPRILAATEDFIKANRFTFQDSLAGTAQEKANPWLLLKSHTPDASIPAIADANSITYGLHRKLGDIVELNSGSDHPIQLRLVAALADSLFQSELLVSEENFVRLFPQLQGYRFCLLDTADQKAADVAGILEDRLSDFGFDVIPADERLAGFHRVENTYLSTFQSLGTLGLVLGTLGLATVLLRNVLERRRELALMRAVGYTRLHLAVMVLAENVWLLVRGLLIGTCCALVAIAPSFLGGGRHLPVLSMALLVTTVLLVGLLASVLATAAALRSPLLLALRAE